MNPHMHVTGYSRSEGNVGDSEVKFNHFLQIVEQPRRAYLKMRIFQLLENTTDRLGFHKTNQWFDRRHSARCNNDCKDSGLSHGQRLEDDGKMHEFEQIMCHYDPPALRLELNVRYLEYYSVKSLGSVEVSAHEYNRLMYGGRKIV